uniref:Uncharacterized protein n=1 Tax=Aegilops tauschii subsp. strangulata TaxID=200361 RepID=A0A453J416_AEGTS
ERHGARVVTACVGLGSRAPAGPTITTAKEPEGEPSCNRGEERSISESCSRQLRGMADWAPVFIGLVLFILLSPGLLFQIPGKGRMVEFGNFQTSGISI